MTQKTKTRTCGWQTRTEKGVAVIKSAFATRKRFKYNIHTLQRCVSTKALPVYTPRSPPQYIILCILLIAFSLHTSGNAVSALFIIIIIFFLAGLLILSTANRDKKMWALYYITLHDHNIQYSVLYGWHYFIIINYNIKNIYILTTDWRK